MAKRKAVLAAQTIVESKLATGFMVAVVAVCLSTVATAVTLNLSASKFAATAPTLSANPDFEIREARLISLGDLTNNPKAVLKICNNGISLNQYYNGRFPYFVFRVVTFNARGVESQISQAAWGGSALANLAAGNCVDLDGGLADNQPKGMLLALTATQRAEYNSAGLGYQKLVLKIDPLNSITEVNEENNNINCDGLTCQTLTATTAAQTAASTNSQSINLEDDIIIPSTGTKSSNNYTDGALGEQKTLVLLLKYQDSGSDLFTRDWAQDRIFNGTFQQFYREQSYGKTFFSGQVYGWYTIPENTPAPNDFALTSDSKFNAKVAPIIAANNIDIGQYSRMMLIVDNSKASYGGISTLGKIPVSINGTQYNVSISEYAVWSLNRDASLNVGTNFNGYNYSSWTGFETVLIHEIGHALGAFHAGGRYCNGTTFSAPCIEMAYLNPFDIMGFSKYALHFNAYFKESLGWIDPAQELIIAKSGRYIINTLEGSTGIKLAKIKVSNGKTPFYLEYRQKIGFDALSQFDFDGLLLNYVPDSSFPQPQLLDMSPSDRVGNSQNTSCAINEGLNQLSPGVSDCWFSGVKDTSLKGTDTLGVPEYNLLIGPIVATTPDSITFDVTFMGKKGTHSADLNQDWKIDDSELTRLTQLYNVGDYHCDGSSSDGFAPGVGVHSCQQHNGDTNKNWKIDALELSRIIGLKNAGGYHSNPSTTDGFAPNTVSN